MSIQNPLKIIFAGTPEFAAFILQALIDSPHEVVAVYTQMDRAKGRGQKITASPVKTLATAHQIPVYQPKTLRDEKEQQALKALSAEVMVVAAYGLILPSAVLSAPRLGCINVHASLLPRWRGAAPIQRAILAGDSETGITMMQMDEGLDTGNILYQLPCAIRAEDTSETLHNRLKVLGVLALLKTLEDLNAHLAEAVSQDNTAATYASKIAKEEAWLKWTQPAAVLDREVRAFNPWPISFTEIDGQLCRVWKARCVDTTLTAVIPGTIQHISPQGIDVATGQGVLRLEAIQLPNARVLAVSEVLNAKRDLFKVGKQLGAAPQRMRT